MLISDKNYIINIESIRKFSPNFWNFSKTNSNKIILIIFHYNLIVTVITLDFIRLYAEIKHLMGDFWEHPWPLKYCF